MIFTIYFIIPNISDGHLYKDNESRSKGAERQIDSFRPDDEFHPNYLLRFKWRGFCAFQIAVEENK